MKKWKMFVKKKGHYRIDKIPFEQHDNSTWKSIQQRQSSITCTHRKSHKIFSTHGVTFQVLLQNFFNYQSYIVWTHKRNTRYIISIVKITKSEMKIKLLFFISLFLIHRMDKCFLYRVKIKEEMFAEI